MSNRGKGFKSCMFYSQIYHAHIEAQKEKHKAGDVEETRKQICLEIEESKKKQRRLESDASKLLAKTDKLCETA